MTACADFLRTDQGEPARRLEFVDETRFPAWLERQPPAARAAAAAARFDAKAFTLAIVPGDPAEEWSVVLGVADADKLGPWCLAEAAAKLPAGTYRLSGGAPGEAALGWALAQYRFERYRRPENEAGPRVLLVPAAGQVEETLRVADATCLVRDLVNTPADDMGPEALAAAAKAEADAFGATVAVIAGDELRRDYPMVHAVGRAAGPSNAPRLVDLAWGDPDHPRVTLVGKGVCFDSGGLDIKPASAMLLMKKDMGGAAHALALARLVMHARLPVRLRLLIPAVENAVSADAFRPGDVLASRAGISVEVENTDAEGRLILADALAAACADKPDLILDFATLTGAARVALGPDLPALFTRDDRLADEIQASASACSDPLWRLPLWEPYDEMLKSSIAATLNSSPGGFAGAITAALFLHKFVGPECAYAHLDLYAWNAKARPGRPVGGEAMALRALWHLLRRRYGQAR